MEKIVKKVIDLTKTYPKMLLAWLFWMGIVSALIAAALLIVGIEVSDQTLQGITLQCLITTCGLAIVNAIENSHAIINVDTATIISKGMNVEEGEK